ncbi:MAG: hypothetical protein NUW02_01225 [Candidatus Campbellbacteria bacterium]|nr:hypothetical protein [Candidatus Campbellbacteria bacterium]
MNDLVKFLFFIIAAVFFISYVQETVPVLNNSSSYSFLGGTDSIESSAAYTRSYDNNNDGVVSDAEYKQGELNRIEDEIAKIARAVQEALDEKNQSVYHGMITLSAGNTYTQNSRDEYLIIEASGANTAPIVISGWKLESLVSGTRVAIPKGVAVLEGNQPWKKEQNVFLAPGERAIINSRYAVGINTGFLENKCTGYLNRSYNFNPSMWQSCPLLEDEDLVSFGITPDAFDDEEEYDACMDGIENTGSCDRGTYASTTPSFCRAFIRTYSTYDGCLELHKTDSDFLGNTWRLFLGSSKTLWRERREAIALIDDTGKVVDILEYR